MTTISKEGLERSVPFLVRQDESSDSGDGLTLTGHAAVFNQETEINSWEGNFIETIAPGAFKKTIRERTPVLQFDHGRHPLVGSIPIGSIESLSEDTEGLYVEARMADNWLIEPVRDAIKNKSVSGMSFRFEVIREKWEDNSGKEIKDPDEIWRLLWDAGDRGPLKRTLRELKVHELGPVVFPAYAGTSVDVRSRQLASKFIEDRELTNFARKMLALDEMPDLQTFDLENPNLSRDVARAILFGDRLKYSAESAVEIKPGNISPEEVAHLVEKQFRHVERENEPSDTEDTHSEEMNDAPLRDEHPSIKEVNPNLRAQMHYARRRMQRRLGYISED